MANGLQIDNSVLYAYGANDSILFDGHYLVSMIMPVILNGQESYSNLYKLLWMQVTADLCVRTGCLSPSGHHK